MPIKIIDLNAETAPSDDDLIVLRENDTGTTRKVTRANFFKDPPIEDGAITTEMLETGAVTKEKLDANAKIPLRVFSVTSTATLTPNLDNYDMFVITAQAATLTIANPTGTLSDGQGFLIRFRDNGTQRTVNYGSQYRGIGITVPNVTQGSGNVTYLNCRWNQQALTVDVIGAARQ